MSKKSETKMQVRSHVIAIHPDWDLKSTWKMVKPNLYLDEAGQLQCKPLDRVPDGEPTHWDIVLVRDDKGYQKMSEELCDCDLSSGEMCPHWREIIT